MAGHFQLVMRTGPAPGKTFELTKNEMFLGRDVSNDLPINDAEISRRHLRLVFQSSGYFVEDLGSTNGTYINEQRITSMQPLQHGDVLRAGDNVTLMFEAAAGDPNATIASGSDRGAAGLAPPPARPAPQPVAPAPPPPAMSGPPTPSPSPAYSGQVASNPVNPPQAAPDRRRNLMIGCGALVVLGICIAAAGLWYIDANYLWCDVFGSLVPGC